MSLLLHAGEIQIQGPSQGPVIMAGSVSSVMLQCSLQSVGTSDVDITYSWSRVGSDLPQGSQINGGIAKAQQFLPLQIFHSQLFLGMIL